MLPLFSPLPASCEYPNVGDGAVALREVGQAASCGRQFWRVSAFAFAFDSIGIGSVTVSLSARFGRVSSFHVNRQTNLSLVQVRNQLFLSLIHI